MLYKSTNQKWTSLWHLAHVSYFTEDQIPRHTEYSREIVSGWGHGQHGQGSSWRDFWNFLLFSSSRRSKSMAASSKAWINPFQDLRAGTWGATAALMPVPITSTSSRGFLVFRLGSNFLGFLVGGAPSLKNPKILLYPRPGSLWKPSSFYSTLFYAIRFRGAGYKPNSTNSSGSLHARQ